MLKKIMVIPKSYKMKFILIIITTILTTMIVSINTNVESTNYMPENYVYVANAHPQLEKDLDAKNLDYCKTRQWNINGTKGQNSTVKYPYELSEQLYLMDIKYNKDTSQRTINQNANDINSGNDVQTMSINYLFDCNYKEEIIFEEVGGGITELLIGHYPETENEILINENYAMQLIQINDYDSYEDLIGKKVYLSTDVQTPNDPYVYTDKEFIISGIFAGNNNNYILPSEEEEKLMIKNNDLLNNSYIIKFDSEKQKEIELSSILGFGDLDDPNTKVIASENINGDKKINFGIIIIILILIASFILMHKDLKNTLEIMNFHSYKKSNYFYVYFWNILIILENLLLYFVLMQ